MMNAEKLSQFSDFTQSKFVTIQVSEIAEEIDQITLLQQLVRHRNKNGSLETVGDKDGVIMDTLRLEKETHVEFVITEQFQFQMINNRQKTISDINIFILVSDIIYI